MAELLRMIGKMIQWFYYFFPEVMEDGVLNLLPGDVSILLCRTGFSGRLVKSSCRK